MKKMVGIGTLAILLLVCTLTFEAVKATSVNTTMATNGSTKLGVEIATDNVESKQYFQVDGVAYVRIEFNDGSSQVQELAAYIQQNEARWSTDTDTSGTTLGELVNHIKYGADWFLGLSRTASGSAQELIYQLSRVFATKPELERLKIENQQLELRIEALERTIEGSNPEEYCQGKLNMMVDYGMRWVTCGETKYHNHMVDPLTGEDIVITIAPMNIEPETTVLDGEQEDISNGKSAGEQEDVSNGKPAEVDIQSITVPDTVKANEEFLLLVTVKNIGDHPGSDIIILGIPDDWTSDASSGIVSLDPEEETNLEFRITPNEHGYRIVAFSSSDFEVSELIRPQVIIGLSLLPRVSLSRIVEGLKTPVPLEEALVLIVGVTVTVLVAGYFVLKEFF